jgi:hypothetical protein
MERTYPSDHMDSEQLKRWTVGSESQEVEEMNVGIKTPGHRYDDLAE